MVAEEVVIEPGLPLCHYFTAMNDFYLLERLKIFNHKNLLGGFGQSLSISPAYFTRLFLLGNTETNTLYTTLSTLQKVINQSNKQTHFLNNFFARCHSSTSFFGITLFMESVQCYMPIFQLCSISSLIHSALSFYSYLCSSAFSISAQYLYKDLGTVFHSLQMWHGTQHHD